MRQGVIFNMWEWLALPLLLLVILAITNEFQRRKVRVDHIYKFYSAGLFAHIIGALFFGLIYEYYYKSGDTFGYFLGAADMDKLFLQSPFQWFTNESQAPSMLNYSFFNDQTGFPDLYMYVDPRTFMVMKVINLIIWPVCSSYLLSTVIVAWFCYIGIWKMYKVAVHYYPTLYKQFAFAILFFPSVLFWASGILKDSLTLTCTGWVVFCIFNIFVLKRKRVLYILFMLLNLYLILIIKPYIIFALFPGTLMWAFSNRIYRIRNVIIRVLIVPFILVVCLAGGYLVLSQLGNYMGKYSLDQVTKTAIVTQNDLKQSYYEGHSFDIGLTDQSYTGMLKKAPIAFVAGTYRPFLWESDNAVMLLSGVENTIVLLLSLLMLLRANITTIIARLFAEPFLFFAFSYSVFFASVVGLTTSNFGALVRFKTAYITFYMVSVFILLRRRSKNTEEATE